MEEISDLDILFDRGTSLLSPGGLGTFAFTDLLGSEPASTRAAAPMRERAGYDTRSRLAIWTLGSHQLATALRALSLNHSFIQLRDVVWLTLGLIGPSAGENEFPLL